MAWLVRLVKTGAEGENQAIAVATISRPDDLVEIAHLGLSLAEGKRLLAALPQAIVAAQARSHAVRRPHCRSCGAVCCVKEYRDHAVATLFGQVRVRLPLCRMRWRRSWPWLAVALPLEAGVGSASGAFLGLDEVPDGR